VAVGTKGPGTPLSVPVSPYNEFGPEVKWLTWLQTVRLFFGRLKSAPQAKTIASQGISARPVINYCYQMLRFARERRGAIAIRIQSLYFSIYYPPIPNCVGPFREVIAFRCCGQQSPAPGQIDVSY
jgi:hypothetical protein